MELKELLKQALLRNGMRWAGFEPANPAVAVRMDSKLYKLTNAQSMLPGSPPNKLRDLSPNRQAHIAPLRHG